MRRIAFLAAVASLITTAAFAGPQGGSSYENSSPEIGPGGDPSSTKSPLKDFKVGGGAGVDSSWVGSAGHLVSQDPHFVPWVWAEHSSGLYARGTAFVNIPEMDFREFDPEVGWNIQIPQTGVTLTPSVTYYARRAAPDEWGISFYGEKSGFFAGGDYYTGMEENWNDSWFARTGYGQTFQVEEFSLTPKAMISYGGAVNFDKSWVGDLSLRVEHSAIPWGFVAGRLSVPLQTPENDERNTQGIFSVGVKY